MENFQEDQDIGGNNPALKKITKLEQKMTSLKVKLTRPFTDIEASFVLLVDDINKINARLKELFTGVGASVSVEGKGQIFVWAAIQTLY